MVLNTNKYHYTGKLPLVTEQPLSKNYKDILCEFSTELVIIVTLSCFII